MIAVLLCLVLQKDPAVRTETRFHRVHLKNGNFVDGDLLRNEPDAVTLKVKTGELEIARDLVERVELVKMRSYAEKPKDVAAPISAKSLPEGAPPVAAAVAPAAGPLQRRCAELLQAARQAPAARRDDLLRELAALGEAGGLALTAMMESLDDESARLAGRALREIRTPGLREPVAELLRSARPVTRAEAVATLALLGVEADLSGDPSPVVRTASLWAAELFKSRAAFERATALCADPSPEVRQQAVRTSFLIAREHDLGEALAQAWTLALRGEITDAARAEILAALGRLRNAGVWPAVADELKRDGETVRVAAARCLGELKAPDAAPLLAEALAVETAGPAKVALAEAAGRLRSSVMVEPLIARLSDPDPKVVRASADALSAITGQNHGVDPTRWGAYWAKVRDR